MVNPYTDTRYAMARLMSQQSRGASMAPPLPAVRSRQGIVLGRTANDMSNRLPSLKEQIASIASGEGGQKNAGVLGAVLGNPITRTALKPLQALAIPGKTVVSGIREFADFVDNNPETKASFSDFTKQIKDEQFGFGKAFKVNTGNIWVDRGIGFIGDVALDPLTYATFGAGKFLGYTGHLDLADNVLRVTGDAALANRVQQYGRAASGLTGDILERAGANRYGMYMFGKRLKVGKLGQGIRIPGTGAIGYAGDALMTRLRVAASRTKAGQYLQKITMPADNLAARIALRQGKVQSGDASNALIAYFTSAPIERMKFGEILSRNEAELSKLVQDESKINLSGYRNSIHRYIEDPSLYESAPADVKRAVDVWTGHFDGRWNEVNEYSKTIDPLTERTFVQRYFPRVKSEDAIRYDADPTTRWGTTNRLIYDKDPLNGGNNFLSRTMEDGDIFFGHKLTVEDLKSTERLNEIARNGGFVGDYFETDIVKVAQTYSREHAKEMGLLAKHEHLLNRGFWEKAEAVSLGENVVDKEFVAGVKRSVSALDSEMVDAQKHLARALDDLSRAVSEKENELVLTIGEQAKRVGNMEELGVAQKAIDDLLEGSLSGGQNIEHFTVTVRDGLQLAADRIGATKSKLAALFGAEIKDGKVVLDALDTTGTSYIFHGLIEQQSLLERRIASFQQTLTDMAERGEQAGKIITESEAALKTINANLEDARKNLALVAEFGNQLESAVAEIASGGFNSNGYMDEVIQVLSLVGRGYTESDMAQKLRQVFGANPTLQDGLRDAANSKFGTFGALTTDIGTETVTKNSVVKMTADDFVDGMPRLLSGHMPISDSRRMGLWVLLRDEHLYGQNIPASLVPLRNELIDLLTQVGVFEARQLRIAGKTARGSTMTGSKLFEQSTRDLIDVAVHTKELIDSSDEFLRRIESEGVDAVIPSVINPDGSRRVDWDNLDVERYPFLQDLIPDSQSTNYSYYGNVADEAPLGTYESVQPDQFSKAYLKTEDGDVAGRASLEGRLITPDGFVKAVKEYNVERVGMFENPEYGYDFGIAGKERRFSRKELYQDHQEYVSLTEEIARIKRARGVEQSKVAVRRTKARIELSKGFEDKVRALRTRMLAEQRTGDAERIRAATIRYKEALDQLKQYKADSIISDEVIKSKSLNRVEETKLIELEDRLDKLVGGTGRIDSSIVSGSAEVIKARMAEKILEYSVVAETISRYNAVHQVMSAFGVPPSRVVFGDIVSSVAKKYGGVVTDFFDDVNRAEDILRRLDSVVGQRLESLRLTPSDGNIPTDEWMKLPSHNPRKIFIDAIDELSDEEQDILVKVLGPRMAMGDPYTFVRKFRKLANNRAAKNEYLQLHVRPWFERTFPGRKVTLKDLEQEARSAANKTISSSRANRAIIETPWSETATPFTIKKWFEDALGGGSSIRAGRVYRSESGNVVGSASSTVRTRARQLRQFETRIKGLFAPDINVPMFVADPLTPQRTAITWADMLEQQARFIETASGLEATNLANAENVAARIGAIGEQISATESSLAKIGATTAEGAPDEFTRPVLQAREAGMSWVEANRLADDADVEVARLVERRNELNTKARTKTGLNASERKELEKVRGDINSARSKAKDLRGKLSGMKKPSQEAINLASLNEDEAFAFLRNLHESYKRRLRSPSHAKALNDREMVRVLDALAHMDLSEFRSGFKLADGTYATLEDGTRIVFTPEEWRSIFAVPDRAARSSDIRRELALYPRQLSSLTERRDQLTRLIAERDASLANPTISRQQRAWIIKKSAGLQPEFDLISGQIAKLQSERKLMIDELASLDEDVFKSAMEKARVLILGTRKSEPVLGGNKLDDFLKGNHPSIEGFYGEALPVQVPSTSTNAISRQIDDHVATLVKNRQRYEIQARKLEQAGEPMPVIQIDPPSSMSVEQRRMLAPILGTNADGTVRESVTINPAMYPDYTTPEWGLAVYDEFISRFENLSRTQEMTAPAEVLDEMNIGYRPERKPMSKKGREAVRRVATENVSSGSAKVRRANLKGQWEASSEFAWLKKNQELEQSMFVKMHAKKVNDIAKATAERDALLARAAEDRAMREAGAATLTEARSKAEEAASGAANTLEENLGRGIPVSGDPAQEQIVQLQKEIADLEKKRDTVRATTPKKESAILNKGKTLEGYDAQIAAKRGEIELLRPSVKYQMGIQPDASPEEMLTFAEKIRTEATPTGSLVAGEVPKDLSTIPAGLSRMQVEEGLNLQAYNETIRLEGAQAVKQSSEEAAATATKGLEDSTKIVSDVQAVVSALQGANQKTLAEMAVMLDLPMASFAGQGGVLTEFWKAVYEGRGIIDSLQGELDNVRILVGSMPEAKARKVLQKIAGGTSKKVTNEQVAQNLAMYRQWVSEYAEVFEQLKNTPDDPVARAWAAVGVAERKMMDVEMKRTAEIIKAMNSDVVVWKENVITPLMDGWRDAAEKAGLVDASKRTMEREGFYGLVGNKEALDLLRNIERINMPGTADDLSKFMKGYTGFFRAYATLSPGFHVRNSISNVFAIFAAGAKVENMYEGFRLWRSWDSAIRQGVSLTDWVNSLPEASREFAGRAARIVMGLGDTKTEDALRGFVREGQRLSDNKVIDASRRFGSRNENSARFMLAYDSLAQGAKDTEAFNRTARYLIDYQKKTALDNMMREIVPFWTWMSRNLPLQIVNRWANPKPYLVYTRFVNNFSDKEDNTMLPGWLSAESPLSLGGGRFFNPDLPFSNTDRQIDELTDPAKLMGYVNPGIRVPMEMLSNKKFFTGGSFNDKFVPLTGKFAVLVPALQAAGQVQYNDKGEPMAREKAFYAAMNLVPFLGKIDRLSPTSDTGKDRLGNSVMGFLGVPFTEVTSSMEDSEATRRLMALRKLEQQRQNLNG